MASIKLLDKNVYELIAAGEVIDGPVAVIKELLENALDAGATSITVEIQNGGRTYMRVTDNGSGIPHDDLPLAFLRHATSKVSKKQDLDCITTLGFRGEALASVCAVAKVEVLTKTSGQDFGTRYVISGGIEKEYEPAGCPDGTSIIVRDIFYNVPARLKFLKRDATEASRVQDLVGKLAISRPEISLKLIKDGKQVILTSGDSKVIDSVYAVYGKEFSDSLMPAKYSSKGIKVRGFIAKPLSARSNRKLQIFYVNGRYVKSDICSRAVEEAYRGRLMTGKFPTCVLMIDMPPEMTDVNVHPTKAEVRFSDNDFVYNSVYFAVKQSLMENDRPTSMRLVLDDGQDADYYRYLKSYAEMNQQDATKFESLKPGQNRTVDKYLGNYFDEKKGCEEQKTPSSKYWDGFLQPEAVKENPPKDFLQPQSAPEEAHKESPVEAGKPHGEGDGCQSFNEEEFLKLCEAAKNAKEEEKALAEEISDIAKMPIDEEEFEYVRPEDFLNREPQPDPQPQPEPEPPKPKPVVVGELFKTYIVAQYGDDMVLIDKHAAHERYIYERIKLDESELSAQTLLDPITVTLSFEEYDALTANLERVQKLGFIIEADTPPNVAVKGLPMLLRDEDPADIIIEIAQKLHMNERDPSPELYDELCHSMACKAAIKANDDSKLVELQSLAESVIDEEIRYCPHGRPVLITMPRRDIEKQFKRIV